jgi:epidermal growth factor receptor
MWTPRRAPYFRGSRNFQSFRCLQLNLPFISVCSGTKDGFATTEPSNRDLHYQIQRDRYTNCTFIDGNLEITWISNATKYNLDHLQHIREVSGYILINHVEVKDVVLPNLQIIRGESLLEWNPRKQVTYALFVYDSALTTLQLPALRAILNGSVLGMMYANVCHLETINWDEILGSKCSKP